MSFGNLVVQKRKLGSLVWDVPKKNGELLIWMDWGEEKDVVREEAGGRGRGVIV